MMEKMKLGGPLHEYTHWFSQLYAVASTDKKYFDWLISNIIKINYDEDTVQSFIKEKCLVFDSIPPCISIKCIDKEVFDVLGNSLDELINYALSNNLYILIDVDPYYIPKFNMYNRKHSITSVLVYGKKNKSYYLGAHCNFPHHKYSKIVCSQDIIIKSFESLNDYYCNNNLKQKINLLTFTPNQLNFNLYQLKHILFEYKQELQNLYDSENVVEKLYDLTQSEKKVNFWIIDSLVEHYWIVLLRYIYLRKRKIVFHSFSLLKTIIDSLLKCMLLKKYNNEIRSNQLKTIKNIFAKLKNNEIVIVEKMLLLIK